LIYAGIPVSTKSERNRVYKILECSSDAAIGALQATDDGLLAAVFLELSETRLALVGQLGVRRLSSAATWRGLALPEQLGRSNEYSPAKGIVPGQPDDRLGEQTWDLVSELCHEVDRVAWVFGAGTLDKIVQRALAMALGMIPATAFAMARLMAVDCPGGREATRSASLRLAISLGQSYFTAQTMTRLSKDEKVELGHRQRARGLAKDALEGAQKGITSLIGWAGSVEMEMLRGTTEADPDPEPLRASLILIAQEAEKLAQGQLERFVVSQRLRVQEVLLGHPAGAEAARQRALSCAGCIVAETELLEDAALVHDFDLQNFLSDLRGQPVAAGES